METLTLCGPNKGILQNAVFSIFACVESDEPKGIIVLRLAEEDDFAEIVGISVKREFRKNGIGTFMICYAAEQLGNEILTAETDEEAVGFYEHTGFSVKPFIRHFHDADVTRYECSLSVGPIFKEQESAIRYRI